MIDPIWAGVIGGAVGGGFTTVATLGVAHFERKSRLDQLEKQRQLDEHAAKLTYRLALITQWRTGLADAAKAQAEWDRLDGKGLAPPYEPDFVGQEWFESLRPLLDRSSDEIEQVLDSAFVCYRHDTAIALSKEISRIERSWSLI